MEETIQNCKYEKSKPKILSKLQLDNKCITNYFNTKKYNENNFENKIENNCINTSPLIKHRIIDIIIPELDLRNKKK